ncbi:hypothetical protein NSERUTF1_7284 [Nocardia seriolae]|nr:hypothetical protein NSERUTF1_7284 [Nocardia seriolae]
MGVSLNGRAAQVHRGFARDQRREFTQGPRLGVEKAQSHDRAS